MCLQGEAYIDFGADYTIPIKQGETVLIPAALYEIELQTNCKTKFLKFILHNDTNRTYANKFRYS